MAKPVQIGLVSFRLNHIRWQRKEGLRDINKTSSQVE